ncbi:MAG: hydrogenase maturation nickel metallochaperone HypA [Bacteroidota bacterium]|nr:hydrogenase maturation nickel metallochaperone HypA [Bacteroidota bacterium]
MHEVSIAQSIVDTLESEMEAEQLSSIREIHVRVGVLSSVEHKLLEHVFKFVAEGGPFSNCNLYTELVEVLAGCEQCNTNFKVENYYFVCPECKAPTSTIIEGNELTIYKIIMEEPTYAEANE